MVPKLNKFRKHLGKLTKGEKDDAIFGLVEAALKREDINAAISEVRRIKNDYYLFLGVRSIVKKIVQLAKKSINKFGSVLKHEKEAFREYLKELVILANSITEERLRAIVFADIAIAFYLIDESLEGDLALRTSLDLAEKLKDDDVTFEIVYSLVENDLLEKAAYAMSLVRNRKKLDVILSYMALHLYKEGREDDAAKVITHIQSDFHKVMALWKMAEFESKRDKKKAEEILKKAMELLKDIENPVLRFEAFVKIAELQEELAGRFRFS
ncbi:hypothetical protein [Thermococcus barophilus]|uniref:Uncharacterized protein n=1 Tax=Thermococcus barophilus TaxID=55802 RepID=A0A0S1XAF5_THEBA|nr:hypothetical protein [Thermococcus barophilus]ALM74771.1 hypothetical protein TBCH5v1_0817 [Thermococcus barophilus]